MIKKVIIKNYRCFKDCEIDFRDLSILVGRNNAGKSTFIEALRLVSVGVNRATYINYVHAPHWLDIDDNILGISPSIENLDITTNSIFYLYGEAPATIKTIFQSGVTIDTFIGEEAQIFIVIYDSNGKNIVSKKTALDLKLRPINILPQISPILREEQILKYA